MESIRMIAVQGAWYKNRTSQAVLWPHAKAWDNGWPTICQTGIKTEIRSHQPGSEPFREQRDASDHNVDTGLASYEGVALESFVAKLDRNAALKLHKKTMERYGPPYVLVTDKLRSYGALKRLRDRRLTPEEQKDSSQL